MGEETEENIEKIDKDLYYNIILLINQLSTIYTYKWEDDLKIKKMKEAYDSFYKSINKKIDFYNMTMEQAKRLLFIRWDYESKLWLFPLYLVPLIPDGLEITYIDGSKGKYCKEKMDNDIRYGVVAYGLVLDK